jgi:hypothetical protein
VLHQWLNASVIVAHTIFCLVFGDLERFLDKRLYHLPRENHNSSGIALCDGAESAFARSGITNDT